MSETEQGLQKSLDNFSNYCDNWQLSVNVKKTKTMVIQNNPPKLNKNINFKYKGQKLENAHEYKYLGCVVTNNGKLHKCSMDLANKAKKALFSINTYASDFGNIPVNAACNLFNILIKPILTYNSEIHFMDSYLKYYNSQIRAKRTIKILTIYLLWIKHLWKRCS